MSEMDSTASPSDSLLFDLLEWISARERSYSEAIDVWRTSCPRFPVWEDATDRGLVAKLELDGRLIVRITALGLALLEQRRAGREAASKS